MLECPSLQPSWCPVYLIPRIIVGVVMPYKGHPTRQAVAILQQVQHPSFPLDLLVRSAAEMRKRYRLEDWFIREIVDNGKVLYEAPHARMGRKSRG